VEIDVPSLVKDATRSKATISTAGKVLSKRSISNENTYNNKQYPLK
jgi:hypothetical protein